MDQSLFLICVLFLDGRSHGMQQVFQTDEFLNQSVVNTLFLPSGFIMTSLDALWHLSLQNRGKCSSEDTTFNMGVMIHCDCIYCYAGAGLSCIYEQIFRKLFFSQKKRWAEKYHTLFFFTLNFL